MNKHTQTPEAIVVRRDSTTGKRVITIKGAICRDPVKLADRLVAVLKTTDERPDSRLFFVTFPQTPARAFRAALVKRIEERIVSDADKDNPRDWEGQFGPRLTLPARGGPSFAVSFLWSESNWYCGFWLNQTTLVLADLDAYSPLSGECSASVSHWHPGSMTSGSWRDSYTVLGSGLDVAWSSKDEEGVYISFQRTKATSPAAVAKRLENNIAGWYLFGAATHLLTAHFMGFSHGTVELFPRTENFGYEIDFSLRANKEVLDVLRKRNPAPNQEDAAEWVSAIRRTIDKTQRGLWEHYTAGVDEGEFLPTLIAIAEGKS